MPTATALSAHPHFSGTVEIMPPPAAIPSEPDRVSLHHPDATTVAACLMIRNECAYLEEWLAFHSLMGISHFRIYDNESDDGSSELIDRLAQHFNIERIVWRVPGYLRQVSAYNDAARSLRNRYKFVAFLDIDEFLFDPSFRPIPQVLAEFGSDVAGVGVNQRVFGSAGLVEYDNDLVVSRFTRRGDDDYAEHHWVKSILRPECVQAFQTSHTAELTSGRFVLADGEPFINEGSHPAQSNRIARSGLVLHHYIVKSLAEFRRKQQRGAVSDRRETGFVRLTDDYFTKRDVKINVVDDSKLLDIANLVRSRINFATSVISEGVNIGQITSLSVNKTVGVKDLVQISGFLAADRAGLRWMRHADQSTIAFNADVVGEGRLQIKGYLVSDAYPVKHLNISVNGTPLAMDSITLDGKWFSLTTMPVSLRTHNNKISLKAPFFVPVRFVDPGSLDPRYLAIAIVSLTLLE